MARKVRRKKRTKSPARRAARRKAPRTVRRKRSVNWVEMPDERLLDMRLCDLNLKIAGTALEERIQRVYGELEARNIKFRPHFWLSNEWFCPDGVPGIAIPFYLAHPRLARLEQHQMYEVEGGDEIWCLKILRHEIGHAIENAYRLRRRRSRQRMFGHSTDPYPEFYSPKPYSKSYVIHLDSWYAQSHPDEDFAETFAIWFTPDSLWQARYEGWPALKKLKYVDALMQEIAGKPALIQKKMEIDPLSKLKQTLREHYKKKRAHYGKLYPNFYDRDLRRLFSDAPELAANRTAESFLKKVRRDVRGVVARWTGEYQYTIDQVMEEIIARCRALKLRVASPEDVTRVNFTVLLTVQTMNYLHSGRHRIAL